MPIGNVYISACIITLNEERNIRDCLESVTWVDEIVVVDALSSDGTPSICREYTDKVVQRPWPGHVAQKNHALSLATHQWVVCLDADERISPELQSEIRRELENPDDLWDGYYFPRQTFYLGRWIRHGGWYPDYKLRLFRKSKGRWAGVDPHDIVQLDGRAKRLKAPMYHYTYRDLADHVRAMNNYTDLAAAGKNRAHVKLAILHMVLNPAVKFVRMYFLKRGFLDGVPGFIVAISGSFYVFLKYAKLWELRHASLSKRSPAAGAELAPREAPDRD
jgi:glycosyltransferase involved in cell wall biosynthesis